MTSLAACTITDISGYGGIAEHPTMIIILPEVIQEIPL